MTKYQNDVDLSETRAKGHNVFREIGGVRVTTDPSDCNDLNPAVAPTAPTRPPATSRHRWPLNAAGEPSHGLHVHYSGAKPSVQLVTDFDNDGTADGILVGETVYGQRLAGSPDSAAAFVKDRRPAARWRLRLRPTTAPLPEWRAAFPNAKILHVGWSLGSGAVGDGVINAITVGLTKYTFSGANRAPVAPNLAATTPAGTSVQVTLTGDRPRR